MTQSKVAQGLSQNWNLCLNLETLPSLLSSLLTHPKSQCMEPQEVPWAPSLALSDV